MTIDRNRADADAPETHNSEQDDPGQAQDVADDALYGDAIDAPETVHGGRSDPTDILPDDVPDTVDRMTEMVRSGRLDFDAYDGEPSHDDEEDSFGERDDDADDE